METTIKVCFQAKEKPPVTLSRKATEKLKHENSQTGDIPKSVTICKCSLTSSDQI
jgi:hypothetical protein